MRTLRSILLYIALLCSALRGVAQDVIVTVAPAQPVLPPQVLLYLADPGKFFTIQLTNTTSQPQKVHIGLQIEQVMPQDGLSISTPPRRQPQQPFEVPANGTKSLSATEMKHLFDHIPASEISAPSYLFDSYSNGSFGLLAEGQYQIHVTAYRWSRPAPVQPVVVSNPTGGVCMFTVCYNAQAPTFLMPSALGAKEMDVAEVDPFNAQFTWTTPVVTCAARAINYEYSLRVVEIPKNWSLDEAMDHAPVVYQRNNLSVAQCIIPQNVITTQFYADRKYAAQVTATSTSSNSLDYVMITNGGKSAPRMFRIKTSDEPKVDEEEKENKDEGKKDDEKKDKDEDKADDDELIVIAGRMGARDSVNADSLYTFRNPAITSPAFLEDVARKLFVNDDIKVAWDDVWHVGGEGLREDTLSFEYEVQLYNNGNAADKAAALAREPFYTHRVRGNSDSIAWETIQKAVDVGDYIVLRVKPIVTKGRSIAFVNDEVNTVDFAMADRLSKKYFECSSTVVISNTTPTSKSAKDFKGKTVSIGQYELTIDDISGSGTAGFKGKGRVEWRPMGFKVMVCVQFDKLRINTDDVVYEGEAKTYAKAGMTDLQVVDKLFSDWGIDNLIGDTGIPYAEYLQSSVTGKVKDIAKKINLASYYEKIRKGQAVVGAFLSGEVKELYMPVALPKKVNTSPVDIQIAAMKFSPDFATMDVVGEFALPNSKYTKNDILVLGAPRLCISPDRVLPEGGTLALLSDFTILDPKSSYEMTFKAPKDVMKPVDGCYVAWKADKLEIFGIDLDMKIPKLVKDVNGTATKEKPILNVRASIASWDDWMVDNVTIDPFQVEALPGWTFTASDIVYDHSLWRNSNKMGSFPSKYDKKKAGIDKSINQWQGLYIKKVGVQFPKSLEFGTNGKERLDVSATDMFFDNTGATLDFGADKVLSAKTGKAGGWSFSLKKVGLSFVQSDFKDCHFSGDFSVPLLKGKVTYTCQIIKQTSNTSVSGQFAYVFKTQQLSDLSMDFFLAKLEPKKEQTYFLLESVPNSSGTLVTNVELMMGGELTVGGTDYLNRKIKNSSLPMKFEIPHVHFCGMRLANCSNAWESKYERTMQRTAKNASLKGTTLYAGKEFQFASGKVYFHTGRWSLASPSKKLGPFEFSLKKYDFSFQGQDLKASFEGEIKLIDGIELSAGAGFSIYAKVSNLSNLTNLDISYNRTEFDKASFGAKFAGMELSGTLLVERNSNDREGYSGTLTFKMPGNLFYIDANGGYYKKKNGNQQFTYGWFYASAGGKAGIPIAPIQLNRVSAGFYYNCKKNGSSADPEEGLIGVVAGIGLSTMAGQDMLSGDFDMTVIYDRKQKRLSTMLFQGKLQAVNNLVKADANIVYQNDNINQYIQVDVTVDASADSEKLTNQVGGSNVMKSLGDLKKTLNSSYTKLTKKVAADGLQGKVEDKKTNNKPPTSAPSKGESLSASAGATISLQVKITMKEKGKQLNNSKWHVYLGEPDIEKRCTFTLLKVNSSILKIDIGANGYICVGNELPNNGKLPDIPYKIRQFLNGSTSSKGLESADVSKANSARERSLQEFYDQIQSNGGGVMFGAQVYGYFDVDLGIFYMDAGATAGFDVSLIKLPPNAACVNLPGKPGWNGWYGSGQLYAYLYTKFGIRINLGFWKKDFDVVDAGIGGVFRMQGPKPTHFDGEARVKLKLLGGLVDINRKFQFSCGDDCDLFMGNALDNFKLFGDLTIGYDNKEKGWADKNKIDPELLSRPCFYTEAPLKEPFRVLDETSLAQLKRNYDGDPADLEMEASRTFIFRSNVESKVVLKEYTSKNSSRYTSRTFYIKGQSRYANYIDITSLNPNRYYEMEVSGYAKEIIKGREQDPLKYNERTNRYYSEAWSQKKTYYFATGPSKAIPDVPNLQDYIAIAYPSNHNKILRSKDETSWWYCHHDDLLRPTFALTTNLKNKAFRNGTLKWKLYSEDNRLINSSNNKWVTTGSTCNMQPENNLYGFRDNNRYKLKLEYETSSRVNNKIVTNTEVIAEIWVKVLNTNWKEGNSGSSMQYEKPFVGCRLNSVTWNEKRDIPEDYHVARDNRYSLFDPYLYIGYLSNYAFIGGWEFDADRMDVNITTAQSVVYTDKGGVYEGKLGSARNAMNIRNDYAKIKSLSIYDRSQWSKFCEYPLPVLTGEYGYALTGLERAAAFRPSSKRYVQVQGYIEDMYSVYDAAQSFSSTLWVGTKAMDKIDISYNNFTKRANAIDSWYQARRGQYMSVHKGSARLQVPAYQFPIIYGSCLDNSGTKKKITAWGTLKGYAAQCKSYSYARGHESISEWIFCGMLGSGNMQGGYVRKENRHSQDGFSITQSKLKQMKSANFSIYRVNAYDFNDCNYTIVSAANGGHIESFDLSNPLTYYNQK